MGLATNQHSLWDARNERVLKSHLKQQMHQFKKMFKLLDAYFDNLRALDRNDLGEAFVTQEPKSSKKTTGNLKMEVFLTEKAKKNGYDV